MVSERAIKIEQESLGLDYMQAYYRVKARKVIQHEKDKANRKASLQAL